jgi:hypothetical protein
VSRIIIAGPWIGEFGGELENWHAWLRFLKNAQFPDNHFVASSYPGRGALYEFADEFWDLPGFFLDEIKSGRYFQRWGTVVEAKTEKVLQPTDELIVRLNDWFDTQAEKKFPDQEVERIAPYIGVKTKFYSDFPEDYEFKLVRVDKDIGPRPNLISVFPRNRQNEPFRNWHPAKWRSLINTMLNHGHSVAILGGVNDSFDLSLNRAGAYDLVGASLEDQIAYLQRSRLAVAPVCGAIRFAAYVGVPTVTFGSKPYLDNVEEAEKKPLEANPFDTPLHCYAPSDKWDYNPGVIWGFVRSKLE